MLTRNLLSSPNVDQERLKRLVTAKDKSIRARNEQIKKIKNEKMQIAAKLEEAKAELDENKSIIDDLQEENKLISEEMSENEKKMKNEKMLEKMKSNQLRDELEKLKRELRKRDEKENMAPPVSMAPPSMTPPVTPPVPVMKIESMATQQSQAQYDNLHQSSTFNFKNRHTFNDNKKRHKLAKIYGDRLTSLEKRGSRQITLPISSWNHPQLTEIVKCLPDEAVDRIGEIFYTGKFRTKTGAPCKVETVILSDSRRLGVEFRPYDGQNKKGVTLVFRRISQNECNTNQLGLKAHFNGRGRPY